jgi:hypothetical protein
MRPRAERERGGPGEEVEHKSNSEYVLNLNEFIFLNMKY